MVTLARTWTANFNQVPASQATALAQAQSVVRAIKDIYLAAGFTTLGSGNSVAAGMDGTDRWTADANLVWAAAGVAHSWYVLASPVGALPASRVMYILIGLSTGAGNPHLINVGVCTTTYTGGSTTADPTTAGTARNFTNKQVFPTPVVNSHFYTVRSNSHDVALFASTDGSGRINFGMGTFFPSNFESNDLWPQFTFASFRDSSTGAMSPSAQLISTTNVAIFDAAGTPGNACGVVTPNMGGACMLQFDSNGDTLSHLYPRHPCALFSQNSETAFRGVLVDIALAPYGAGVLQGTCEPASGPTTTTIFGEMWIPNGGVTPVL